MLGLVLDDRLLLRGLCQLGHLESRCLYDPFATESCRQQLSRCSRWHDSSKSSPSSRKFWTPAPNIYYSLYLLCCAQLFLLKLYTKSNKAPHVCACCCRMQQCLQYCGVMAKVTVCVFDVCLIYLVTSAQYFKAILLNLISTAQGCPPSCPRPCGTVGIDNKPRHAGYWLVKAMNS